jgi:hypothetical protein
VKYSRGLLHDQSSLYLGDDALGITLHTSVGDVKHPEARGRQAIPSFQVLLPLQAPEVERSTVHLYHDVRAR